MRADAVPRKSLVNSMTTSCWKQCGVLYLCEVEDYFKMLAWWSTLPNLTKDLTTSRLGV